MRSGPESARVNDSVSVGGIVLCGGQSRRMGIPKATLPFGEEVMLTRVLRLLGEVVDPLLVVAAPAQQLPPLGDEVLVVRDRGRTRATGRALQRPEPVERSGGRRLRHRM